jgi:hypothetical protein
MRRVVVAFVAAALLAACPGNQPEDESKNAPAQTSTTSANPQAVPENSSSMNPVIPPQKEIPASQPATAPASDVDVQLTEYEIRIPDSLPAGAHRFRIVNAGKENHGFAIDGAGVAQKLASDLSRGDSGEIVVTLQPGTYNIYCPVDGHKGKGMQRTLTVHQ